MKYSISRVWVLVPVLLLAQELLGAQSAIQNSPPLSWYRGVARHALDSGVQELQRLDKGFARYFPDVQTRKLASAVIFPELCRRDGLREGAEDAGLLVLYMNFGGAYGDFSVGVFQMKPSFAERLEADDPGLGLSAEADSMAARSARIKRLLSADEQLRYLASFMKIVALRFPASTFPDTTSCLRFWAAAYNAGYWLLRSEIERRMGNRYFHLGNSSLGFSYADLSVAWYGDNKSDLSQTQ